LLAENGNGVKSRFTLVVTHCPSIFTDSELFLPNPAEEPIGTFWKYVPSVPPPFKPYDLNCLAM